VVLVIRLQGRPERERPAKPLKPRRGLEVIHVRIIAAVRAYKFERGGVAAFEAAVHAQRAEQRSRYPAPRLTPIGARGRPARPPGAVRGDDRARGACTPDSPPVDRSPRRRPSRTPFPTAPARHRTAARNPLRRAVDALRVLHLPGELAHARRDAEDQPGWVRPPPGPVDDLHVVLERARTSHLGQLGPLRFAGAYAR
jgi:hypothetical protein